MSLIKLENSFLSKNTMSPNYMGKVCVLIILKCVGLIYWRTLNQAQLPEFVCLKKKKNGQQFIVSTAPENKRRRGLGRGQAKLARSEKKSPGAKKKITFMFLILPTGKLCSFWLVFYQRKQPKTKKKFLTLYFFKIFCVSITIHRSSCQSF